MSLIEGMEDKVGELTEEINDLLAFRQSEGFRHLPPDERKWHDQQIIEKVTERDKLALETIAQKRNKKLD